MDTQQTIRDEIMRRSRAPSSIAAMVAVSFMTAGGLFALTARRTPSLPHVLPYVILGAIVLFVTAITLLKRSARGAPKCPKCGTDLGPLAFLVADTPGRKRINFCPYCAVNLDDPMPAAPTPAENVTTPDKLVWK